MEQSNTISKREELIEIGSALFYEQGYQKTGIKQIIETAGIAKGTFYSHFKSKEELGIAWLQARHKYWNNAMEEYIKIHASAKPSSKILSVFDYLENWMVAFINTLAETPAQDSLLRKEIESHKRDLLAFFQALVNEHFSQKQKKARSQLASCIYILFEGALIEMQNFCETWPAKAAKEHTALLLK